jgi:hypothetical protein
MNLLIEKTGGKECFLIYYLCSAVKMFNAHKGRNNRKKVHWEVIKVCTLH